MITVKAIILDEGKVFEKNVPVPQISQGEILVRVLRAGICRTDLEMLQGYLPYSGIMGHEFVGVVERDPNGKLSGQRVVGEINISCGDCPFCLIGLKNHCQNRKVLGIRGRPGAFAEYVALPRENVFIVPGGISLEEAVFTEPLAAAFQILEQVHIPPSETIAVLGDGKLGLLVAMIFGETGLKTLILGHHREKMQIVEQLGVRGIIAEKFEGEVDVVVDCTGNTGGLGLAQKIIKPRGTIVLKTTVTGKMDLETSLLVTKEITIVGSRCGPFQPALRILERGRLPIVEMVEKIFPFTQGLKALDYSSKKGVKKVILNMES